jgi:O-antigen/teichoic acid export membrane protein
MNHSPSFLSRRSSMVRQSLLLNSDNLGRRVATGAGYKFLGIALRTAITIGSTAILARLLSPAEFGYIAMATVITEFAGLFGAFGFTNVLVQRRVITRLQLDTVFWATLAIGTLSALVVFVLSFFAEWLFSDPQVGPLLQVLSLTFVLNSLVAVPWVVLSRLMNFGAEFWLQLGIVVVRTAAAVASAYAGFGVWSLVIGALVGGLAGVVVNFARVPYLPRFRFHLPLLTATWRTSGSYFGSSVLYYINMNLDLLLIGRQLGATSLGFYQNARSLTDEIRARIAMPIQHVLFPAFSAVQGERERFQQLVLRAGRLLAAIVIPVGVGVSANANELVQVLYGEKWLAMIPVMSMFGLSAALRASTAISSPLFNASNRVGLALRYNVVGTILSVVGVVLAMPYGVNVVAMTVAATSLYALVGFRAGFALIGLGARDMAQVLGLPALAALVMWLATFALRQVSAAWGFNIGVMLLLHVTVGGFVYLVTLHLLSRQYLQDVRQAVQTFLSR